MTEFEKADADGSGAVDKYDGMVCFDWDVVVPCLYRGYVCDRAG